MAKIFGYELKRLLLNRFTIGLAVVIGFYSYWVMQGEIIMGIANTAPFSPWSFGVYMARIMPLLLVALLFFISFLYSGEIKAFHVLTDATATRESDYRFVRYGAIAVAFLLVSLIPVIYVFCFYGIVFHFTGFSSLIMPLLIVFFPTFILTMGLGVFGGQLHSAVPFVLMAVVLLLGVLQLPQWADLYGASFFATYPEKLGGLDPEFSVPGFLAVFKALPVLVGVILTIASANIRVSRRK